MTYDAFDTRKLSPESRAIVNRAIMAGLTSIMADVNAKGFASEVFKSKRTEMGSLRAQLRVYLDGHLRCRRAMKGPGLVFMDVTEPLPDGDQGMGFWRKLGTNAMAVCLGLKGSALRHHAMDEREKKATPEEAAKAEAAKQANNVGRMLFGRRAFP